MPAAPRGSTGVSRIQQPFRMFGRGWQVSPSNLMELTMTLSDDLWWQRGILYQVYPRSFQDTNDDGIGDLRGIIERLPYLKSLGIQAVWLSPIFPSPMADFGYDICDYTGI